MRAIVLEQFGPIDNLKEAEVPIPVPSAGEVLIKTSAVSVNPIDYKTGKAKGRTIGRPSSCRRSSDGIFQAPSSRSAQT